MILGFFCGIIFLIRKIYLCLYGTNSTKKAINNMAKRKISRKRLEEKLLKGEVKFSYEKLDGSVREVRGTTNTDMIPEEWKPSGGTLAHAGTAYFDLDIQEWRSISAVVSKVNLLS